MRDCAFLQNMQVCFLLLSCLLGHLSAEVTWNAEVVDLGILFSWLYNPDSRIQISFRIAAIRSGRFHGELECFCARFLWMSVGRFSMIIRMRRSPSVCSDFPSEESTGMWLFTVL